MDAQSVLIMILIGFVLAILLVPLILIKLVRRFFKTAHFSIGGMESKMTGFFIRKMGEQMKMEFQGGEFDLSEFDIHKEIKKVDSEYKEQDFLNMAEDCFGKYCESLSKNDSRLLKAIETEELFLKHNNRIRENKAQNRKEIHHIQSFWDRRILNFSSAHGVGSIAKVVVEIKVDLLRYDAALNGNPFGNYQPEPRTEIYHLTFEKQDVPKVRNQNLNCPNCGAPHTIQTVGICEYCKTMVVVAKDNWLLFDIKRA